METEQEAELDSNLFSKYNKHILRNKSSLSTPFKMFFETHIF